MGLGQLPAQCRGAISAEDLGHGGQGVVDAAGGLQEDHGALLGGQGLQGPAPLPRPARQESLEAEAVGGQSGQGQGGQHRRGARCDRDGHLLAHRRLDEPVPGVGDRWHAGVGDDQDTQAGAGGLEQLGGALALIVLVEGDDAPSGLDVEALGQGPQPAGVLGGDEVGLLQGATQPQRGVGDIADRGGGQGDRPAAQVRAVGGGSIGGIDVVGGIDGDGCGGCGRAALSHRTQYVGAPSMKPPPTLGV